MDIGPRSPAGKPYRRPTAATDHAKPSRGTTAMLRPLVTPLFRFLKDESGPTAVEYAVMLALIIVVMIGGIMAISNEAGGMYGDIDGELTAHGF